LFTSARDRAIFRAAKDLSTAGKDVDLMSLNAKLNKAEVFAPDGAAMYLVETSKFSLLSEAGVYQAASLAVEDFMRREVVAIGHSLIGTLKFDNPFEQINEAQRRLSGLVTFQTNPVKSIKTVFEVWEQETRNSIEGGTLPGVSTGFTAIDKQTGGWQPGALIIIAARPGMGKTAFVLNTLRHSAMNDVPVAIFSLEMTDRQLVNRLVSEQTDFDSSQLNQKRINVYDLKTIVDRFELAGKPFYMDQTPALDFEDFVVRARRLKHEKDVKLIAVDYLQLMKYRAVKGNREREVAEISAGLKKIAKDLNVPIIALSQLSRETDKRTGDKTNRPQLSDLRESGALEQDADMVAFLFRPEYYQMFPNGYDYGGEMLQTQNLALFHIAKGREVDVGEAPLKFYGNRMRFTNYTDAVVTQHSLSPNSEFLTNSF
jgi:replicative DNA helicase